MNNTTISQTRILIVGCGGIGCELIKILYLHNQTHITLIDFDTISMTNLNRQFIFKKDDVGGRKCTIMRDRYIYHMRKVNIDSDDLHIIAYEKDVTTFDIGFFEQFDIIYNCLDNSETRSFVNKKVQFMNLKGRMCVLVDGGSTGFLGQSWYYGGFSECYDCLKSDKKVEYPVCSIRTMPTKYEHCVVWAKTVFVEYLVDVKGKIDAYNEKLAKLKLCEESCVDEVLEYKCKRIKMDNVVLDLKSTKDDDNLNLLNYKSILHDEEHDIRPVKDEALLKDINIMNNKEYDIRSTKDEVLFNNDDNLNFLNYKSILHDEEHYIRPVKDDALLKNINMMNNKEYDIRSTKDELLFNNDDNLNFLNDKSILHGEEHYIRPVKDEALLKDINIMNNEMKDINMMHNEEHNLRSTKDEALLKNDMNSKYIKDKKSKDEILLNNVESKKSIKGKPENYLVRNENLHKDNKLEENMDTNKNHGQDFSYTSILNKNYEKDNLDKDIQINNNYKGIKANIISSKDINNNYNKDKSQNNNNEVNENINLKEEKNNNNEVNENINLKEEKNNKNEVNENINLKEEKNNKNEVNENINLKEEKNNKNEVNENINLKEEKNNNNEVNENINLLGDINTKLILDILNYNEYLSTNLYNNYFKEIIENPENKSIENDLSKFKEEFIGSLIKIIKRKEIVFDKDDDLMMDLIHNISVLRALSFGIDERDRTETENIAGSIIPSICTTNSIVASLMVHMGNKLTRNDRINIKINDNSVFNNYYLTKSKNIIRKIQVSKWNKDCIVCKSRKFIFCISLETKKILSLKYFLMKLKEFVCFKIKDISVFCKSDLIYDLHFQNNYNKNLEIENNNEILVKNVDEYFMICFKDSNAEKLYEVN